MSLLSGKRTYELPLSREYVKHWGMAEAVREIIQNALDSESPFEYEFGDDWLRIHSKHTILPKSTLLLGSTSKGERDDAIGSFGEGYKIALLVLTRLGYTVRMLNGDRVWQPIFRHSKQFDAEVLCIEDTPRTVGRQGLTFEVEGLTPSDIESIRDSCLQMQDIVGETLQTRYGRILKERPGKLYVGGLFVCDTKLKFGYDVLPKYLRLERDRQTVSGWDMQMRTKEMWFDTERYDEIAELLSEETPDLEYAEYGAPDLVKEACYRHFREKHPGSVIAKDQEELEELVEKGMTVYVHSGAYGSMVKESRGYNSGRAVAPPPMPQEILQSWFDRNTRKILPSARAEMIDIIKQAENWRRK